MRHPVAGKDGLMTREWLRQQSQVQAGAQTALAILAAITGSAGTSAGNANDAADAIQNTLAASAFDQQNIRDFQPAIWEAFLQDQESARPVYDDSELRKAIAGSDTSRVYDDSELRNALAGLDTPNPNFQQQLDELRNLIASLDTPRGGATGTFTSADGHTVTVQAGLVISIV
jgi:hypothetical protein